MSEKIIAFGESLEVEVCPSCKGSGNYINWSRELQKHVEDKNYPCERCKGARYIIISFWKKDKNKENHD